MKKLMFYCQHILGMGHLIRSMEIVRGLVNDFEICFINGGEVIQNFQVPQDVTVVNLPAIKTDTEFRELRPVDASLSLEAVQETRKDLLLNQIETFQPDVLMVELFPFGRRRFSFELIPLMEAAKARGTKVVCSLRDIVVTKQDQARHEAKICRLMNQYFDQLLIHGDPNLHPLEDSFSRVADLNCEVHYTGYVAQQPETNRLTLVDRWALSRQAPMILVSVGGGRFGHELLRGMVGAAEYLSARIPHHIQMFTGPFIPESVFWQLKQAGWDCPKLHIHRYTPNLLAYMQQADLSVSMSGYNTTMNILTTGVNALMLPFTGNDDQEQTMRVRRLDELGVAQMLQMGDVALPDRLAQRVEAALESTPQSTQFDLDGVRQTAQRVRSLVYDTTPAIAA
ncbi:glycosyltransferase [Acaryochloris sp. IP29b_bin.148]|uniref:glycosyltransferase family protein n=1 Tax=Acaryochloris sp. IP29b_bin.148 TaxID=2969218 RepID=UPI002613A608|nr:glycosyltransferase [Acaryochloris sp. IP29b_bin.148]